MACSLALNQCYHLVFNQVNKQLVAFQKVNELMLSPCLTATLFSIIFRRIFSNIVLENAFNLSFQIFTKPLNCKKCFSKTIENSEKLVEQLLASDYHSVALLICAGH